MAKDKRTKTLTARDVMTRSVITVRPEMSILHAVGVLVERRISGAPVTDEDGNLHGILSEHDCLRVIAGGTYDGEHVHLTQDVSDLMTRDCQTVTPETDIHAIASLFLDERIRRVPVVDSAGKLVGLVSRRDILLGIAQLRAEEDQQTPPDPSLLYLSASETSAEVIREKLK